MPGMIDQDAPGVQRDRWLPVVGAGLAVFMAGLDMSIVNVALPAIQGDLQCGMALVQWVVLGYLLPLIGLALPSGRWVDRVGKRAAFVFGAAGFALASAAAGAAPTLAWLIGARVAQGAFAAVLFAIAPVLPTLAVRPQARGRAMGVITTVGPLGLITGPSLGGVLVSTVGWAWIFYVNVPVAVLAIGIMLTAMPADGPLRPPDRAWFTEAGLLASAGGVLLLSLSLTASDGLGWLPLVLLTVPPLVLWRRMASSQRLVALVRTPGLAGPLLALLATMIPVGLLQFIAPFYLQRTLHASTGVIGGTMLAFAVATALAGPLGGMLADRWNAGSTALAGAAIATAGIALIIPLGEDWQPIDLAWRLALVGLGGGLFNGPNLAAAMAATPRNLLATAAASTSLARQLGLALGPALATTIWALSNYTSHGLRMVLGVAAGSGLLGVLALTRKPRKAAVPTSPQ
jgi:MFS family permease